MRKITMIAACVALAQTAWAGKPVPYSTPIADDADWQIVNVQEGSNTWITESTSDNTGYDTKKVMYYKYDWSFAADDWLISPAISLEGGKEYKVKIRCKISDQEIVKIFMGSGNTPEDLKAGKVLFDKDDTVSGFNSWNTQIFIVKPETSGDWYFGIWEGSPANKYYARVTGFEVLENVFAPGKVTGLSAVPDANKAIKAEISWTLPTVDSDGLDLPEGYTVDNVYVYRDGSEEPVATLDGSATSWTDTEATGLTGGYHSYEVAVKVNGAMSAKAKTECGFVGPISASPLPWDPNIKTLAKDDFNLFFTIEKGAGSEVTKDWEFKESSWSGNSIQLYFANKKADDWLFTPPLKAENAGIYRFKVNAKCNDNNPTQTEVYIGTGAESSAYTDADKVATLSFKGTQADYYAYFKIEEPKTFHLALRETCANPGYNTEYIYGMAVEEWYESPLPVEDLTASLEGETVTLSWMNPGKSNIGVDLSGNLSKIEIFRGSDETPVITITDAEKLLPGAKVSVNDLPGVTGVVNYKVVPWLGEHASEGEQATVYSPWIGDDTQELPYACDFKDASLLGLWHTANLNGDADEWQVATTGAKLNIAAAAESNDVLMTPPFDLKAGYYKVAPRIGLPIKGYPLKVGAVKADNTETPELIGTVTLSLSGATYSSGYEAMVNVTEDDKYRFAFLADGTGAEDKDNTLKIEKVEISYIPVTPGLATDITIVPDPDLQLKATVSWKNPTTTNVEGIAPIIKSAKIYRKGEQIAEITEGLVPGEVYTYIDETVPEAGEYNYRVEIYGPEGCNGKERGVRSPWIGGGLAIENGYFPADLKSWTAHNVNGDTDYDDYEITWETPYGSTGAEIDSSKEADDWLISPRLSFMKGNLYEVSLISYNGDYQKTPVEWDLYAGSSTDHKDMTRKIATITTDDSEETATARSFRLVAVDPSELEVAPLAENETPEATAVKVPAGVTTIGFHHRTKGSFKVDAFKILKPVPTGINEMEVTESTVPMDATDITVFDMTGRVVAAFADAEGYKASTLAKGFYVVRFTANGTVSSIKTVR